MSDEKFFVTGALGCLGAWVVRNLIREGVGVTVYDLGSSQHRLELLMEPEEIAQIRFVQDDITDTGAVARAVEESGVNRIIHLAALQVPFCKASPPLGAAVNVVGTVNVFEAAKRVGISPVIYASSMAVYGGADLYGPEVQDDDDPPPAQSVRRLQGGQRGHRPHLLAGRRHCQLGAAALHGLRPGARPGHDLHTDTGHAGRGQR